MGRVKLLERSSHVMFLGGATGCNVTCARSQVRVQVKHRIKPRRQCTSVEGPLGRRRARVVGFWTWCSVCWTEHRGGSGSTRTIKLKQSRHRQRGRLQNNRFGDGWIEHLMCRRYVQATKELRGELKRRSGEAIFSRRTLNLEVLMEDVEALLRYREDGTVEVHRWITELPHHAFPWLGASVHSRKAR